MQKRKKIKINPKQAPPPSPSIFQKLSELLKTGQSKSLVVAAIAALLIFVVVIIWAVIPSNKQSSGISESVVKDKEEKNTPTAESIYEQLADKSKYVEIDTLKDVFRITTPVQQFLNKLSISPKKSEQLAKIAAEKGLTQFEQGRNISVYALREDKSVEKFILYKKDKKQDALFTLFPVPKLEFIDKEFTISIKGIGAILQKDQNILEASTANKIPLSVFYQLGEAMKWTVDLFHLAPGDRFKVLYEELVFEDQSREPGQLLAVSFESDTTQHFAYFLPGFDHPSFFDEGGALVKRGFLKAPVEIVRISSAYNLERLHPVTGVVKPHYGTDYAAEEGAPIMAVGDGIVTIASFTSGNGNYVKIRHDGTYETQYLHMKGFANGIEKGAKVRQGQVIGYVGSTGLATGPHVCFRFWKDGKQVDPTKEDHQFTRGLNLAGKEVFIKTKDTYKPALSKISYF